MMDTDRGFALVDAPGAQPAWPTPPAYAPLWDAARIQAEFEALITFRGHEAMPVVEQEAALGLMLRMAHDYDLALAKALFDAWALEGVRP